jgi:hypothetical protein
MFVYLNSSILALFCILQAIINLLYPGILVFPRFYRTAILRPYTW